MQSFYDGMTLVGSLVVMVLIIVFTYYASRWYAGKMKQTAASRFVKILDRVSVGPGCSILIVQAGDKFYLMGTSDKNIQMLCELTDFDPGEFQPAAAQPQFAQLFKNILNKTDSPPKDNGTEQ